MANREQRNNREKKKPKADKNKKGAAAGAVRPGMPPAPNKK
jgi:hypothetical protein